MIRSLALAACLALLFGVSARAQNVQILSGACPAGAAALVGQAGNGHLYADSTGNLCTSGAGGGAGGVAGGVTLVPPTGTPNETTVTCGVASTTLLAAASATQFILVKVPSGGSTVWVNSAGNAAVAAPPSVDLTSGATLLWSPGNGYVPASQLNCIAAVAQAVSLLWK